jgi:alanine racemase
MKQTAPFLKVDHIPARASSFIQVDLNAVAHNYGVLKNLTHAMGRITPTLKANAYGLGLKEVANTLLKCGATGFFVATLDEAITLRSQCATCEIFVLGGYLPGAQHEYLHYHLTPVLSTLEQVKQWTTLQKHHTAPLPAILHVDTGMNRTGITEAQFPLVLPFLKDLHLRCIMSHYVSSECLNNPTTKEQYELFQSYYVHFRGLPYSLANSHGLLWPHTYHGHWVRPGIALGGMCTTIHSLRPALGVYGKIVQIKPLPKGQGVGYNHTYRTGEAKRVATVALGYGDGLHRLASPGGVLSYGHFQAPLLGRVSMDFVVVDITYIPENLIHEGDWMTYFDTASALETMAQVCQTTAYELLTSLQGRGYRHYNYRTHES